MPLDQTTRQRSHGKRRIGARARSRKSSHRDPPNPRRKKKKGSSEPGLSQGTRNKWGNKWGVQACALPHLSGKFLLLKVYSLGLETNPPRTSAKIHQACELNHAVRPPRAGQHADRNRSRPQWRDQRRNHPKPHLPLSGPRHRDPR